MNTETMKTNTEYDDMEAFSEYERWYQSGIVYACSNLPAFKNRPLIPSENDSFPCWFGFFKGMEDILKIPGSVERPNYDDTYTTTGFSSDDFTTSENEYIRGFKTAKEMETEIVQFKGKDLEFLIHDYDSPDKKSFISGFKCKANMIKVKNKFVKLGFIKFIYPQEN